MSNPPPPPIMGEPNTTPAPNNGGEGYPLAPNNGGETEFAPPLLGAGGAIEPERYELNAAPAYDFSLTRRSLFSLMGAGLLVFVALSDADAQESGRQRRGGSGAAPQVISAWLHIAESGVVTVYTGKTEVGQNIRTSLSQAVAEELHVPVSSVLMVMADTDLTPYDMGTFGSRTTPTMAPQLHRAAAAARDCLMDLAATNWKVGRVSLSISDGKIRHKASGREIGYGPLLRDQKLTQTISGDVALTPVDTWKIAGTSISKVDGRDFVTGRHKYTSDVKREEMLHGKVLRPAAFNATLTSVDMKAVEAIAGVTAVHDGNFIGVACPTVHQAESALSLIKAQWDSKPQISSDQLFESLHPQAAVPINPQSTIASERTIRSIYNIAYIAHAPLEPRAAVAEWNSAGDKLTVWTGNQRPFGVRQELAQAFRLQEDHVRVIVPDTGSGYGGKHTGEVAIEAARLSKAAGKPVKLVWTREEEFTWAYFRPAGVIDVTGAVREDGLITGWEFHNYNSGNSGLQTPYFIPTAKEQFHQTQYPLKQGSYRGLASTANHFARESHMDDLAHSVKMDPLDFRLKNCNFGRLRNMLEAAADKFDWKNRKPQPGHGFGIAGGTEKGSYVANCVEVSVDKFTGKVSVLRIVTAFECGKIVNPTHLQNQVEGAVVMGLGGALSEAIRFEQGKILNPRFSSYRVPRFKDTPPIEVVLLDRKDIPSAGAGETPIVTIAPAIRNAIFNATGKRHTALPMT